MSKLLAYTYTDRCRVIAAKGSAGAPKEHSNSVNTNGTGSVSITSSVGLRSANLPHDVTKIQNALNRIHIGRGGPERPLIPDGVCGTKTVEAIQKFQLHHFGWSGADGKINPGGETIAKLNEKLALPAYQEPPVYPPDSPQVEDTFNQTVNIYLVEARRWINETRYELRALEPFIDTLDKTSASYARLDNVFSIGQSNNKRRTLQKILLVYDDMERAFQRQDSSGNSIFELYKGKATGTTRTGAIIAFTTAAGFFMVGGEVDSFDFGKTRTDKVYLLPSGMVIFANMDSRFFTGVLIHELSHFVGGWHSVGTIEDWSDEGTPLERLRSANCYQKYADAVHFQTNGK